MFQQWETRSQWAEKMALDNIMGTTTLDTIFSLRYNWVIDNNPVCCINFLFRVRVRKIEGLLRRRHQQQKLADVTTRIS
jgi:hypothetical protein